MSRGCQSAVTSIRIQSLRAAFATYASLLSLYVELIRLRKNTQETLLPIPDFQSLMLPLLEHVADGAEYTIAGSRDILADRYNMTEEERSQRLPSGSANTFYNRLAWAKTYLERGGLLIKIKRGVFKISTAGIELLRNPPERIDINYLQRFDAFNQFRKKSTDTNTDNIEPSLPKENEATPEEALDLAYKELRDDLATQLLAQIKSATQLRGLAGTQLLRFFRGKHAIGGRSNGQSLKS